LPFITRSFINKIVTTLFIYICTVLYGEYQCYHFCSNIFVSWLLKLLYLLLILILISVCILLILVSYYKSLLLLLNLHICLIEVHLYFLHFDPKVSGSLYYWRTSTVWYPSLCVVAGAAGSRPQTQEAYALTLMKTMWRPVQELVEPTVSGALQYII